MPYKATILSQQGNSYQIQVKQRTDVIIFYRSYNGADKINQDLIALEAQFNDVNKKAIRDAKKQERKDLVNIKKIQSDIDSAISSITYSIPKSGNSTQSKVKTLRDALQAAINSFIGSL